jgi:hypothetical protein
MPAIGLESLEDAEHLLGRLTVSAVRHQFRITQDGVERCAQFVAHVGEKLRLVLACDLKLPALVLDFIEQSHVLDCNGGLVGKGLQQLDVLFRKRLRLVPREADYPDGKALTEQRHAQHRSVAAYTLRVPISVFLILEHVGNVDDFAFDHGSAHGGSSLRQDHSLLPVV